jgi:hypothetical protein
LSAIVGLSRSPSTASNATSCRSSIDRTLPIERLS